MTSRFADPATMRTRSPICHDDSPKRPPPSPSNKGPPSKKLDAKSHAVSEEPCLPPKASPPVTTPSSEPHPGSCTDKYLPEPALTATLSPKPSSKPVIIDMDAFGQVLELDEEEDHEFSRTMVKDYIKQADSTIGLMNRHIAKCELVPLSKLGHFLKGSSAALGVVQVREICEKVQHLGNQIDADKGPDVKISVEEALARIKQLVARLKDEQTSASKWFDDFFSGSDP